MVTVETPTRNLVLGKRVLDTGFFHPIPVSEDSIPVNLGRYEITYATLVQTHGVDIRASPPPKTCSLSSQPPQWQPTAKRTLVPSLVAFVTLLEVSHF